MNEKVYQRIKELRIENRYAQKDIAKMLCISQAIYSRMERGKIPVLYDQALKISKFYEVPIREVYAGALHQN